MDRRTAARVPIRHPAGSTETPVKAKVALPASLGTRVSVNAAATTPLRRHARRGGRRYRAWLAAARPANPGRASNAAARVRSRNVRKARLDCHRAASRSWGAVRKVMSEPHQTASGKMPAGMREDAARQGPRQTPRVRWERRRTAARSSSTRQEMPSARSRAIPSAVRSCGSPARRVESQNCRGLTDAEGLASSARRLRFAARQPDAVCQAGGGGAERACFARTKGTRGRDETQAGNTGPYHRDQSNQHGHSNWTRN